MRWTQTHRTCHTPLQRWRQRRSAPGRPTRAARRLSVRVRAVGHVTSLSAVDRESPIVFQNGSLEGELLFDQQNKFTHDRTMLGVSGACRSCCSQTICVLNVTSSKRPPPQLSTQTKPIPRRSPPPPWRASTLRAAVRTRRHRQRHPRHRYSRLPQQRSPRHTPPTAATTSTTRSSSARAPPPTRAPFSPPRPSPPPPARAPSPSPSPRAVCRPPRRACSRGCPVERSWRTPTLSTGVLESLLEYSGARLSHVIGVTLIVLVYIRVHSQYS